MNIEAAYEECERITRVEAKNFYQGIRLLPRDKRNAMSALYAYARRIDDIADGDTSNDDKLCSLDEVDAQIDKLASGELPDESDAVLVGLHHAAARYGIPVGALAEIVEGCRHDALARRYTTTADTEQYCRLVAGSVGRLSLGVFGSSAPDRAPALADDLGVALQLTNILRDIVEDRGRGRIYLPRDAIARFGCAEDLTGPPAAMRALIEHIAGIAESYYGIGLELLPLLDRRSRACVAAMAGIYRQLLRQITKDPLAVLHGRMSVSTPNKLRIAGRSLIGKSP